MSQDSLDVPHQSSTGATPRTNEVHGVSHTGDNSASMSSVLNEWFFHGDAQQPQLR